MSCWSIVDAPCIPPQSWILKRIALTKARRSTPGWRKNLLSSHHRIMSVIVWESWAREAEGSDLSPRNTPPYISNPIDLGGDKLGFWQRKSTHPQMITQMIDRIRRRLFISCSCKYCQDSNYMQYVFEAKHYFSCASYLLLLTHVSHPRLSRWLGYVCPCTADGWSQSPKYSLYRPSSYTTVGAARPSGSKNIGLTWHLYGPAGWFCDLLCCNQKHSWSGSVISALRRQPSPLSTNALCPVSWRVVEVSLYDSRHWYAW